MIALINPWGWAVLAALLAGAELVAPGVFLIWLAAAAATTAFATALVDIAWEVQLVLFAGLSVLAVVIARVTVGQAAPDATHPALNRRADQLIGTIVTVTEPMRNGRGRVQIDDSEWPATGPDLPVGAPARIVAVEGTTLHVEPG